MTKEIVFLSATEANEQTRAILWEHHKEAMPRVLANIAWEIAEAIHRGKYNIRVWEKDIIIGETLKELRVKLPNYEITLSDDDFICISWE
jgi:hypothetical protein